MTQLAAVLGAVCVGFAGGASSGLLGVSPGGALVVLAALFLGADQHLAQGISLAAQIPPTGISAINRYRAEGHRPPLAWILWLAAGVLVGGPLGAIAAAHTSASVLRWSYAGYLVALDLLVIFKSSVPSAPVEATDRPINPFLLIAVGLVAGLSSGYLGIGGGLAIVVGLSAWLEVPQHKAQITGLILTIMPLTIPAAYVYWRAGLLPSAPILLAVLFGLWAGTDLGARAANRISSTELRRILIVNVSVMALYMAWRAQAGGPT